MRRTKSEAMETRAAILDAAETVFHRQGVARTTLSEIALCANVTRGAIYWHFSGKAQLFRAMTERVEAPEEEFFLQQAERDEGISLPELRDLVLEMMRRFVADERAQRVHEILLFRCEHIGEMGDVMASRHATENAFNEAILDILARLSDEGRGLGTGWSPENASNALRCAVMGAISDWLRLGRSYDLVEIGAALLDALFASFARGRIA